MSKVVTLLLGLAMCAVITLADIPRLINYQGRLTDAAGAPVSDGEYQIVFGIYGNAAGGSSLWSSGTQLVSVNGGLFNYQLGSTVPLPENIFEDTSLWLGIQIGNPPAEIFPRTRLVSSAFSWRAIQADTAVYLRHDCYINDTGDVLHGSIYFDGDSSGMEDGLIEVQDNYVNLYLNLYGETMVALTTDYNGGQLDLYDDYSGYETATLGNNKLMLYDGEDYYNNITIRLNGRGSGDAAVNFPDSAINDFEILNEPGISYGHNSSLVTLSGTTVVNIASASINIPAPGYVVACATGIGLVSGTTIGDLIMGIEASSTSNPSHNTYYTMFGSYNEALSTFSYRYGSLAVQRIFEYSSEQLVTLYLNGTRMHTGGDAFIVLSQLTLTYYPTAYGAVKSIVSIEKAAEFEDASPIEVTDFEGKNARTLYEVDLQELVLKAKEARIKAMEAELELERARTNYQKINDN